MFDIGFWELGIIGVVALLVIGPEKLPKVARSAGLWVGKARRFVSTVKADIDREMAADELKNVLKKQAGSSEIHDIVEQTKQTIQDAKSSFKQDDAEPSSGQSSLSNKPNDRTGG